MPKLIEVLESARQLSETEREQLRHELEALARGQPRQAVAPPTQGRTTGLNRGQIIIGADFNDPLPDEYMGLA